MQGSRTSTTILKRKNRVKFPDFKTYYKKINKKIKRKQ